MDVKYCIENGQKKVRLIPTKEEIMTISNVLDVLDSMSETMVKEYEGKEFEKYGFISWYGEFINNIEDSKYFLEDLLNGEGYGYLFLYEDNDKDEE